METLVVVFIVCCVLAMLNIIIAIAVWYVLRTNGLKASGNNGFKNANAIWVWSKTQDGSKYRWLSLMYFISITLGILSFIAYFIALVAGTVQ